MKGQFLLMRVQIHRDVLTVWSLCAGPLCSPLDPLFNSSLLTCRSHIANSLALCLHLGLANRECQQETEGELEAGIGCLLPQKPSCKSYLSPSPEAIVPIGEFFPYGSLFPGSLTCSHPCPLWLKENHGSLLGLALGCCATTGVSLHQDHTLHVVSSLNPLQITHLPWAICFLSEPN